MPPCSPILLCDDKRMQKMMIYVTLTLTGGSTFYSYPKVSVSTEERERGKERQDIKIWRRMKILAQIHSIPSATTIISPRTAPIAKSRASFFSSLP
jgi:hypothetical protein